MPHAQCNPITGHVVLQIEDFGSDRDAIFPRSHAQGLRSFFGLLI